MAKIEILKIHKGKKGTYWNLIHTTKNGFDRHSIVEMSRQCVIGEELEVPSTVYKSIDWMEFCPIDGVSTNMSANNGDHLNRYTKNTKLNFGLYKGYEIGIIYAMDPTYLEWCIFNVEAFFIEDLQELQEYCIVKISSNYLMAREIGIPNFCLLIDEFESVEELSNTFGMANVKYRFKPEIIEINEKKRLNAKAVIN
jgi:hypothetical protein